MRTSSRKLVICTKYFSWQQNSGAFKRRTNLKPAYILVEGDDGGSVVKTQHTETGAVELYDWLNHPHRQITCPFCALVSSAVICNCLMIFRFWVLEKDSQKSDGYWSNTAVRKSNESLRKTWHRKGLLKVRSNLHFLYLKAHLFLPFTLADLIKDSLP